MSARGADCRSFTEKYTRFRDGRYRALAATVLGSDRANGYTTPEQADAVADTLALGPKDRLLDLGGGRGWPGMRIAERSGCRLVTTELPWEALRAARDVAPRVNGWVVAADGRRLPFRDAVFDAIVHADVLC